MGKLELYNDNCFEVLPKIEDKSVDLVVCDLPYNMTSNKWDDKAGAIDLQLLWDNYSRIVKDKGIIILFGLGRFSSKLIESAPEGYYRYSLVWDKRNSVGFLNAKKQPLRQHEDILVFYKKAGGTYNPQFSYGKPYKITRSSESTNYNANRGNETVNEDGRRYPTSILSYPRDTHNIHPTQKPVALLEYLIKTYSNVNDTILDNTMGGGSTMIAANNLDRNFIGIEISEDYFEKSIQRLRDASDKLYYEEIDEE